MQEGEAGGWTGHPVASQAASPPPTPRIPQHSADRARFYSDYLSPPATAYTLQ